MVWKSPMHLVITPISNWESLSEYSLIIIRDKLFSTMVRSIEDSIKTIKISTSRFKKFGSLIGNIITPHFNPLIAKLSTFEKENLFQRSKEMSPYFQKGLMSLKDIDVIDNIRGYGMMGGIDMKLDKKPGAAGFTTFKHCYEAGVNFKATGDCLIIAPMFISEKKHIDEIIEKLRTGITNYAKSKKN